MKKVNISPFKKVKFEYKITLFYLIIGLLWIILSDTIFNRLIQDKELLTELQTIKGFLYIVVTSLLLFYLVNMHMRTLYLAKEKAEESERLKSAFLANMSHEIRTPMNGILGFVGLLKEPRLTGEEQREYIGIIEKSGVRLLNIINDIVDISKIEAGQMVVNIKETNINEQIEYINTFFQPEFERKGLQFSFKNALTSKEAVIKTDREKIYAILINLVKNAIKYTYEGAIDFGYKLKAENGFPVLEFFIKDTGVGVPIDRQEAIFERFVQADVSDKMALQGAGLGLSISKAYVEMLGGKIRVESEPGKGSAFYFTIPYTNGQKEKNDLPNTETADPVKYQTGNLKILIAEDDDISEKLLRKGVKIFGKEILRARTGVESVEICHKTPDIDLILMDIKLPGISGYEATRQIRQFNKNVIIIAQTAYGLAGDRDKAIEAGCNEYISKPISMEELLSKIKKCFI